MFDPISAVGGASRVAAPASKPVAPATTEFKIPTTPAADEGFPATPPPEVLASLDKAARVIEELASRQVNLHFAVDEKSQRVEVEVRDGSGKLVRKIPQEKALDVLAGDLGGLTVEARG
jgi:hypothetical protein